MATQKQMRQRNLRMLKGQTFYINGLTSKMIDNEYLPSSFKRYLELIEWASNEIMKDFNKVVQWKEEKK